MVVGDNPQLTGTTGCGRGRFTTNTYAPNSKISCVERGYDKENVGQCTLDIPSDHFTGLSKGLQLWRQGHIAGWQ